MKKTLVLLLIALIASGCSGDSTQNPEKKLSDTLSDPEADRKVSYEVRTSLNDISPLYMEYTKASSRRKYKVNKSSPGGMVTASIYKLENKTVACELAPGLGPVELSCSIGETQGLHELLQVGELDLRNLSYNGKDQIRGLKCNRFSAGLPDENIGELESAEKIDFCVNSSTTLSVNLSSSKNFIYARAKEISDPQENILLPRSVAIVGHCTDSYDVGLTPLKRVEKGVISINGQNKTVDLPARFEHRLYDLPENSVEKGFNTITVYAGNLSQSSTCFRRN